MTRHISLRIRSHKSPRVHSHCTTTTTNHPNTRLSSPHPNTLLSSPHPNTLFSSLHSNTLLPSTQTHSSPPLTLTHSSPPLTQTHSSPSTQTHSSPPLTLTHSSAPLAQTHSSPPFTQALMRHDRGIKKDQGWRRQKLLAKDGGEVSSCVASLPICVGFTSSLVPNPVCQTSANKVEADIRTV